MKKLFVESQLLEDQLAECLTMAGRLKLTVPALTEHETQILFSMLLLAVRLGHWVTKNSSLIRCQKRAVPALEELASELWDKLAEGRGAGKAGRELTHTRSKRNSGGKP